MKFDWLKYLALPFGIRRGYFIEELMFRTQNLIAQDSNMEALGTSQEVVRIGNDKLYEARIFEGLALSRLKRREESASAFSKAIFLLEKDKCVSEFDKSYLVAYCFSFFKEGGWPSSIKRPSDFPELPPISKVSRNVSEKFPFEDYPD